MCSGLTSESVKIPPPLPGSLWYSTTLLRFPCLGQCLNVENEGDIKLKITVEELEMCRSSLLFFIFVLLFVLCFVFVGFWFFGFCLIFLLLLFWFGVLFVLFFLFSGDNFYLALAAF